MGVLEILLMVSAVVLIILSLLQSGKSEGLGAAFGGGNDGLNIFVDTKERGSEKLISQLTMGVGILFFVLVIIIRIFA